MASTGPLAAKTQVVLKKLQLSNALMHLQRAQPTSRITASKVEKIIAQSAWQLKRAAFNLSLEVLVLLPHLHLVSTSLITGSAELVVSLHPGLLVLHSEECKHRQLSKSDVEEALVMHITLAHVQ